MKNIGPSFYDELDAHGSLVGEHFTWSEDGNLEFFEDTPPAVVEAVQAVYGDHNPDTPSVAEVTARVAALMVGANEATAGMADAFVAGLLDEEEEAMFKSWAAYKVALSRIFKQPGYPLAIEWPVAPAS